MPHYFDRFEYSCAEAHRNVFDLAYVADEPSPFIEAKPLRLPENLPCSGCQYKLIPVSLVLQTHSNLSEMDFYKFQENKYVESVAYHEAAHVVVAAAQQMPLKERGIRIDQKGSGFSHYNVAKPDGSTNLGSEPKREKTIRSTQAGYIAQEKFYLRFCDRLPPSGASNDTDGINKLVEEMYSGRNVCEDAKGKLFTEAQQLVEQHWQAIEALAQTLLNKEWKSQVPPSGERRWSTQMAEKKLDGSEVVVFLRQFQISASIQSSRGLEQIARFFGTALGHTFGGKKTSHP